MIASPSSEGSHGRFPMTVFAFALGGVCLIGLPPSGGFLAKWLLLEAAVATGQWWWAMVMLAGGLFTSGYMFIVLSRAVAPSSEPLKLRVAVPRYQEAAALALALTSLLLGLVALGPIDIFQVGRPEATMVGTAMMGQSTLLAGAFARSARHAAGMPLAAGAEPDAFAAGVRPDSRACRGVACRLRFLAGDRFGTPAFDFRPGPSRSHAAGRRGAVVDRIRCLCLDSICRAGRTAGNSSCAG